MVRPPAPSPLPISSPSTPGTRPSSGLISGPIEAEAYAHFQQLERRQPGAYGQGLLQHLGEAAGGHFVIEAGANLTRGAHHYTCRRSSNASM